MKCVVFVGKGCPAWILRLRLGHADVARPTLKPSPRNLEGADPRHHKDENKSRQLSLTA